MMYECKYQLGEFVYIVTDEEQKKRQITGIDIRPTGVSYHLYFGTVHSEHFEFEISSEQDIILKTNN